MKPNFQPRSLLNSTIHTAPGMRWPTYDRDAPQVQATVVPERGPVAGAVFRYTHRDGHRTAALATFDDEQGKWTSYVQPLPPVPPSAEFAGPFADARAWLKGGPS